jgi:DNA-binding transcriptional regulator GbsR (MarR family)
MNAAAAAAAARAPHAPAPPAPPAATIAAWQAEFVERAGLLLAGLTGLPPSHTRLFAWLVVCEPPEQSVDDLQAALGLSPGAISMATAALVRMGVVERTMPPGTRRRNYRVDTGAWRRMVEMRRDAAAQLLVTAKRALSHAPPPQPRLEEMHAVYAWFDRLSAEYAALNWERPTS